MKHVAPMPPHRPFLPPLVTLTHEHGATVVLATAYDEGLSNEAAVERLYLREAPPAPRLELNAPLGTVYAHHVDKPRRALLKNVGFFSSQGQPYLDLEELPDEGMTEALKAGFALDERLLALLSEDGAIWERRRAWREADLAPGGAWHERARHETFEGRLVEELMQAIRSADDRAVHLTPMPDGTLRRRLDPWNADLKSWEGQYDGAAMVAIRRHEGRLNAYVPSGHWLVPRLQLFLMEAWGRESFGERGGWK